MHESEYSAMVRKIEQSGGPMLQVTPEHFAKLVYSAVEYAQSFGFAPHADYRHARLLLTGIDATQCQDIFEFGKDGKPLYFQGPHDSPAKVKSIMEASPTDVANLCSSRKKVTHWAPYSRLGKIYLLLMNSPIKDPGHGNATRKPRSCPGWP